MSYQWNPCFPSPLPNFLCIIQAVVTKPENDKDHMAVTKLINILSSTCGQDGSLYLKNIQVLTSIINATAT
jgi:hypothetical protein